MILAMHILLVFIFVGSALLCGCNRESALLESHTEGGTDAPGSRRDRSAGVFLLPSLARLPPMMLLQILGVSMSFPILRIKGSREVPLLECLTTRSRRCFVKPWPLYG